MTGGAVLAPVRVRRAIVAHARRERPNECCGFLIGADVRIEHVVPMTNVSGNAKRFRVDDAAHIELRRLLRRFLPPLAIVGVYHSHPGGPPEPSPADVAEAMYPEWIHMIVGLRGGRARVRAFRIVGGRVRALEIRWRTASGRGRRS